LDEAKPDSNSNIRFVTDYLCFIEGSTTVQTTDGVLHLTEPYVGPQLKHNDPVIFTGKMLMGDYLEGMIRPATRDAANRFKEYAVFLKNKGEFVKKEPKEAIELTKKRQEEEMLKNKIEHF
jgi:hypothetical protein